MKYMPDKKVSSKDLPSHKSNPFLQNLRVPTTPKSSLFIQDDEAIINRVTGNYEEGVLLRGKRKYVDAEHFVKIFVREIEIIFDLTRPAQKVFAYLLSKVEYDDKLHFDIEDCRTALKYKSESQVFAGVKELLLNEFIAKTTWTNVYWINPKIFYKGDRLAVLREYRQVNAKPLIQNQLTLFEEEASEVMKEVEIENQHLL